MKGVSKTDIIYLPSVQPRGFLSLSVKQTRDKQTCLALWIKCDTNQTFHSPTKSANQCAGNKQGFFFHCNIFVEYQIRHGEVTFSLAFAFMVTTNEELESGMGDICWRQCTN
jgi:hypothetical protein